MRKYKAQKRAQSSVRLQRYRSSADSFHWLLFRPELKDGFGVETVRVFICYVVRVSMDLRRLPRGNRYERHVIQNSLLLFSRLPTATRVSPTSHGLRFKEGIRVRNRTWAAGFEAANSTNLQMKLVRLAEGDLSGFFFSFNKSSREAQHFSLAFHKGVIIHLHMSTLCT